jgi:hypothetical protein
MTIEAAFIRDEIDALIDEAPKTFNAEMNREFARTGTDFFRQFQRERLSGKSGIQVRRRVRSRSPGRGGVAVPAKARAMGFNGILRVREKLDGKELLLRNSNPIAIAHEEGATIRPKKGQYLFVRIRNLAAARRAGVQIRRGRKPRVIRIRQVKLRPRLGFIASWTAYVRTAIQRLGQALERGSNRAIELAKRKAG